MKQFKLGLVTIVVVLGIIGIITTDHVIHTEFMKGFTVVMLLILLRLMNGSDNKNLTD